MAFDEWRVRFRSGALRDLKKLDNQTLVAEAVEACADLAYDPTPSGSIKMRRYKNMYRIRFAGGYRIVYKVDEKRKTILIWTVGPRGTVYRGMRNP